MTDIAASFPTGPGVADPDPQPLPVFTPLPGVWVTATQIGRVRQVEGMLIGYFDSETILVLDCHQSYSSFPNIISTNSDDSKEKIVEKPERKLRICRANSAIYTSPRDIPMMTRGPLHLVMFQELMASIMALKVPFASCSLAELYEAEVGIGMVHISLDLLTLNANSGTSVEVNAFCIQHLVRCEKCTSLLPHLQGPYL